MRNRFVFYFPASGPGGVQSIILRFFDYLRARGMSFVLLDLKSGFLYDKSSYLVENKYVSFERHIIESLSDYCFRVDDILIIFNWQILDLSVVKQKINYFFWDVHTASFEDLLSVKVFGKTICRLGSLSFLEVLARERRLMTIDNVARDFILRKIRLESVDIRVTGIPIGEVGDPLVLTQSLSSSWHFVAVSRAVDWKLVSMVHCLNWLASRLSSDISLKLYTDSEPRAIGFLKNLDGRVQVEVFSGYSVLEIVEREKNWMNCSLGMGTSQFEFLKYGIPTFAVPATVNVRTLAEYIPIWVHDMPEFVFGFDDSSLASFSRFWSTENYYPDLDLVQASTRAGLYVKNVLVKYSTNAVFDRVLEYTCGSNDFGPSLGKFTILRILYYFNNLKTKIKEL
jgi:hypothetical protein